MTVLCPSRNVEGEGEGGRGWERVGEKDGDGEKVREWEEERGEQGRGKECERSPAARGAP